MKHLPLTLYNSLTRHREIFQPINSHHVRLYVCGPTVYDFAHIGNARPVIVFDILFRLLRHFYGKDHVTYVRNITDVDDKINARARIDFPHLSLNEAIQRVSQKNTKQFHDDMSALGCLQPTHEPRATDFVQPRPDGKTDMITMIKTLIERGYAYEAKSSDGIEILFNTLAMSDYGRLSNRKLEDQKAGARVSIEPHKKKSSDFVLWKQSSNHEPGWDSPWGRGRPGWHIECSAMSTAYLGEIFDIHGGGIDLIFPHHENEIAQSRCAHGTKTMANIWMHNGFLQVEGQKMSKSLGNFVTVYELLHTDKVGKQKWPGEVIRLAMLKTHYREPIDFTANKLKEAAVNIRAWRRTIHGAKKVNCDPDEEFLGLLADDLRSWDAFNHLNKLSKHATVPGRDRDRFIASANFMGLLEQPSQFSGEKKLPSPLEDHIIMSHIEKRLAFIHDKDWIQADKIRDQLLAMDIQLQDGKDPETGERITTWELKC